MKLTKTGRNSKEIYRILGLEQKTRNTKRKDMRINNKKYTHEENR